MSRIYEALRRAEAERAAAEGKHGVAEAVAVRGAHAAVESDWHESASSFPELMIQVRPETVLEPLLDPLPEPALLAELSLSSAGAPPVIAAPSVSAEVVDVKVVDVSPLLAEAVSRPGDSVDLEHIASSIWTPSLAQLPAVQERGRTVEQFRSLRSRVQEFRGANRLKSILISSGLPQEGKSFVAVNLAISLARHKISRVLLIDGDMRRSSLHKVLGCPNDGPGLTEYLSGQTTLQGIMKRPESGPDGVLPNGFGSLVFIGAGKEADKAADLSGNHRFTTLIAAVSPLFDWVIVDSSPVNLVSDGVNLGRSCDGVLLIARGAVTKLETAQRAVAALESCKVLGVVLNAVNNDLPSRGYYDYDSTERA